MVSSQNLTERPSLTGVSLDVFSSACNSGSFTIARVAFNSNVFAWLVTPFSMLIARSERPSSGCSTHRYFPLASSVL